MTTCINRDLSVGVDAESVGVLDWLTIRTCQLIPSVMTRLCLRPYDVLGQANRVDLYWVPGFVRCDMATGRYVPANKYTRQCRLQLKTVAWSGEKKGYWVSGVYSRATSGAVMRVTPASKSLTWFWRKDATKAVPVTVRSGVGMTGYNKAAYVLGFFFEAT